MRKRWGYFDKALKEGREAKIAVHEDTKNRSPEEARAYFLRASEDFAKELGMHWIENPNGTRSLAEKCPTGLSHS